MSHSHSQNIPIVIFAFNRPEALQRLIDSLRQCPECDSSPRIVFVDGPRRPDEQPKVDAVIEVARSFTDDVRVSQTNKGLGPSIIAGVTEVINKYGSVIVLEDDLVCAPGLLRYINDALDLYRDDPRIISICGYGLKIKRPQGYEGDVFASVRSSSWGWATWADRWAKVDWEVKDFESLKADKAAQRAFNRGGSDMYSMLRDYMEGRNRSWAIRFCYAQHRQGLLSIHPFRSLVSNEGFGTDATNCRQTYQRFKIDFDDSGAPLSLPKHVEHSELIDRRLARYHSVPLRIYSRIRRLFGM